MLKIWDHKFNFIMFLLIVTFLIIILPNRLEVIKLIKNPHINILKIILPLILISGISLEFLGLYKNKNKFIFPFSLILSVFIISFLMFPNFPRRILWPDSGTYINHYATRGIIYPYFIDLFVPNASTQSSQTAFEILSWVQWIIFTAMTTFFMLFLRKIFILGGILFPILLVGYQILFPNGYLISLLWEDVNSILTEGLSHSWLVGLVVLSLLCNKYKNSILYLIFIGLYCYLGIELAPRMIIFNLIIILPIILSVYEEKKITFRSLYPLIIFMILFFGRCAYTKKHYGTFSTLPFAGISYISMTFQFADKNSVELFSDLKEKNFIKCGMEAAANYYVKEKDLKHFINPLITASFACYQSTISKLPDNVEKKYLLVNEYNDKIYKKVLLNKSVFTRWMTWTFSEIKSLYTQNSYISFYHLLFFFILLITLLFSTKISYLQKYFSYFLICTLLILINFLNLFFTISSQGVLPRYLISGDLLIPIVCSIFILTILKIFLAQKKDYKI